MTTERAYSKLKLRKGRGGGGDGKGEALSYLSHKGMCDPSRFLRFWSENGHVLYPHPPVGGEK